MNRTRPHPVTLSRADAIAAALTLATALLAGCGSSTGATGRAVAPPTPAPVSRPDLPARIRADGPVTHTGKAACRAYMVPVLLAPAHGSVPFPSLLWTRLCAAHGFDNHDVQVLLPGAGYDHHYYDWPDPRLNYVSAATASSGHPVTLEVDLMGTGHSDHPDGHLLTIPTQAYIVSQLLSDLRSGLFGATFSHITLVGHSVGGYIAWTVAAHYHDIDGLVLLDALHPRDPAGTATVLAAQHDAAGDPRFAGLAWAKTGYMAVADGARCRIFYYAAGAYPGTCAQDERIDATVAAPTGEFTSLAAAHADQATNTIKVPVLIGVGEHDILFDTDPVAVHRECTDWYSDALADLNCGAVFEAGSGHDTNLHRQAMSLYKKIFSWQRIEVDPR